MTKKATATATATATKARTIYLRTEHSWGEEYRLRHTTTEHGHALLVESHPNIYRTEITQIPLYWEPKPGEERQTLGDVLNAATIALDAEGWTAEEFAEEYGSPEDTEEEKKKVLEGHRSILRATKAAFPGLDRKGLHELSTQVDTINENIRAAQKEDAE